MKNWDDYEIENIIQSYCISKYDLLSKIAKVYDKKVKIEKNDSVIVDKCLVGGIQKNSIDIQIKELRKFYNEH
jgi:hypothetical protein